MVFAKNSTYPPITFYETDDKPAYYVAFNDDKRDGYQKKAADMLAKYFKDQFVA